jgi:hypothetical protein
MHSRSGICGCFCCCWLCEMVIMIILNDNLWWMIFHLKLSSFAEKGVKLQKERFKEQGLKTLFFFRFVSFLKFFRFVSKFFPFRFVSFFKCCYFVFRFVSFLGPCVSFRFWFFCVSFRFSNPDKTRCFNA